MRLFNIPDITTDGSFTLGGAVTAGMLVNGQDPWSALPVAMVAGFLAGTVTGFIHARLRVNALLSGILVMTSLYSVNLAIMKKSNIPLVGVDTVFPSTAYGPLLTMAMFVAGVTVILAWFLRTDAGLAMQATGNNEVMMRALGTDTGRMKILGLGLANSLVAFSGSLITQLQGYADINMGVGIVILGLGSVILGELLTRRPVVRPVLRLAGIAGGTILFRLLLAWALSWGVDPVYLKLIVAMLVLACIAWPALRQART